MAAGDGLACHFPPTSNSTNQPSTLSLSPFCSLGARLEAAVAAGDGLARHSPPTCNSTNQPSPLFLSPSCSLGARLEAAVAAGDGLACHNLTMVAAHLFLSGALRPDVVHSMLDTWRER